MHDLAQSARLFDASTRLQSASTALEQIATGVDRDHESDEALKWVGTFMPSMDWSSGVELCGGLAVQATSARPTFYASLQKIGPQLIEAQIETREDVHTFLATLWEFLQSGGHSPSLDGNRLRVAANLLHEISQGLLSQTFSESIKPSRIRL